MGLGLQGFRILRFLGFIALHRVILMFTVRGLYVACSGMGAQSLLEI